MTPPVGNSQAHVRQCRHCNLPYTFDPEGEGKAVKAAEDFAKAHAEKKEEAKEVDDLLEWSEPQDPESWDVAETEEG